MIVVVVLATPVERTGTGGSGVVDVTLTAILEEDMGTSEEDEEIAAGVEEIAAGVEEDVAGVPDDDDDDRIGPQTLS